MAQSIITRFRKGSDSGAIETALLAGAYLKTIVKSTDGKKLTFTLENADETSASVSFVGTAATRLFEQHARVPGDQQTAVVYVPRDYVDGDAQAQTVTVGQFDEFGALYRGFSTGDIGFEAYGAFPGRKDIIGIHGPVSEDGTTFTLNVFHTFNLGLMRDITKAVINGVEYDVGPVQDFEGAYSRSIIGVAALPVATVDFTLNFIFADSENYYRDGTEVLHKAGLYLWNKDLVPPAYEFVGVNSRVIVTDGDPPAPSAANNGALVIAPNGVYQYFSEPVHRLEPVVAWEGYAAADYRGAYNSDERIGDAQDQPANSRFYNTSRRRFRVRHEIAGTGPDYLYRWVDTSSPANSLYPFHFHSRDEAATHASAVGQIAFTGYRVEVVSAYAAAIPASTLYHSRRLLTAGEELDIIVHRAALPSAAEATFDRLYGKGAEETDSLHFKRRSELDELYLRADNLVASSFNTIEIVGFTTESGVLFHAGGAVLPVRPDWLTGISQEFVIGGASYEVFLQTNGEGPVLPATDTVRMDVNAIGSDVVRTVFLVKASEGNAWEAVLNDRLFTAGLRYRIRLRLGDAGDVYLTIGTEDHISKIAGDHEVDELEGEVRAEVKAQRTALDGEIRAKADTDLQNVSAALSDTQQGTVRTRIGAAAADLRGQIQTKGEIWGISPELAQTPPAGTAVNTAYPFAAGERWTVTQHAPAGVHGDETDLLSYQLEGLPLIAPAGVEGLWFELLVDGELVDDVRVPWGIYPTEGPEDGVYNLRVQLKASSGAALRVNIQIHRASNAHQLNPVYAAGDALPTGTRLRIREARPSFPAISGGQPGDVVGPRVAHISTAETREVNLPNNTELIGSFLGDQIDGNAIWTIEADAPAGFAAIATGDTPATVVARLAVPRNRPADNVSGFVVRSWIRPTYAKLGATLPSEGLTATSMILQEAPLRPIAVGAKFRIEREIIEIAAIGSDTTYTVIRAQDGTVIATHTVVAGSQNPRVSGLDLELYDDADFEWGPGNIYNSNQGGGLNTALTPLKLDADTMVHARYVELSDEDEKYISLWGRSGRAPVGTRIDVHLKIEEIPDPDVVDGRLNGLGTPAADGSEDNKVGITNDGLHHVHLTADVPPVRSWLLSGPAASQQVAEETDGVTSTGSGHFHFLFYRASPDDPGTRNDWIWGDDGFSRSPTLDLWNADRNIVEQQNTDNHPIWILIGSVTRAANGNYSYAPWSTHAEFGAPLYSVDQDADSVARHPVKTDSDNWLWLRDANGDLVGPIPLTDRNYSRQLLFNDYLYASTPGAHNTKPFVRDLSTYDAIEIEIRPYQDYDSDPAAPCSALLFRPADGFLVATATSDAEDRYQVRAWDQDVLKVLGGDSPVRDDDFLVSATGEYKIHFRFIFKVAGANSDDRHITEIVAFDHGALYNRCRFLVWGINF